MRRIRWGRRSGTNRPTMTVSVSRFIPADPAMVWDLLVDTSRWAEWGPSVTAVDAEPVRLQAGSTGRVRTRFGFWAPFVVNRFDEGRSWDWTVAGIAATSHTVQSARGGCRLTFGVPTVAAPYVLVCLVAMRRIERLARTPVTV